MGSKPQSRRPDWRRIKIHRSYTVDEIARTLNVSKGTVRRWIKKGLPALDDQKPMLVLGVDLAAFGKIRRAPKQKCKPHECYCVKCRAPAVPSGGLAEFVPITATSGNLRGLCPTCGTLMHKRVTTARLADLGHVLCVSLPHGQTHLMDTPRPSSNDHLAKESPAHG